MNFHPHVHTDCIALVKAGIQFSTCVHKSSPCLRRPLSVQQEERKSKLIHDQLLGDDSAAGGDGGWVDSVQKKKVVHTGGKQVAEFLNMDDLKTVDDVVAERIYMEDLK
jgi:hypothetical protein